MAPSRPKQKAYADMLGAFRARKYKTQQAAAQATGYSLWQYARFERGDKLPGHRAHARIADTLVGKEGPDREQLDKAHEEAAAEKAAAEAQTNERDELQLVTAAGPVSDTADQDEPVREPDADTASGAAGDTAHAREGIVGNEQLADTSADEPLRSQTNAAVPQLDDETSKPHTGAEAVAAPATSHEAEPLAATPQQPPAASGTEPENRTPLVEETAGHERRLLSTVSRDVLRISNLAIVAVVGLAALGGYLGGYTLRGGVLPFLTAHNTKGHWEVQRIGSCEWAVQLHVTGLRPHAAVYVSDHYTSTDCKTGAPRYNYAWGPVYFGHADTKGRWTSEWLRQGDFGTYHYVVADKAGHRVAMTVHYQRNQNTAAGT